MLRIYKFLIIGFFLIITISSLFIYWMKSKEDTFADEIISNASEAFKGSLKNFLLAATNSIGELNTNIKKTDAVQFKSKNLDLFFSKMILDDKYLLGVVIAHNDFSYIIYRDNKTWATVYDTNLEDSLVNWQRLNNKLEVVSEWTDNYSFLSGKEKIGEINNRLDKTKYIWIASKSQLNDRGDLLTNLFQTKNNDGDKIIAGLIFSAKELSNNFISVLKFENPLVSIITSGNEIVTPIVTTDTAVLAIYDGLKPEINAFINKWQQNTPRIARSYSFEKFNKVYWTRIDDIGQSIGADGFAITISAIDLAETERKQEQVYLYITVLLFVITVTIAFVMFRKKKLSVSNLNNRELVPLSNKEVEELIAKGETEYVEFKSSIRWDYREEKVNKILEYVILKSIAAFANAKGGTLLIGVSDDLEILGLEKDFNTLKKQDADYFELHTRKLINNQYGIAFSNENLLMGFPVFGDKTICSIQIKASSNPVFLKSKSKQGQEIEKFYVRSGNASQEIASLKEVNEYINIRFS
ncbi:MAG: ATP-binding protein [Bacteroidota bacterium]